MMNEPKRRGRPPKLLELPVRVYEPGNVITEDDIAGMVAPVTDVKAMTFDVRAQAYAFRVWAGQSESADRAWRIQRVKEALEGQGLSMEGVVL